MPAAFFVLSKFLQTPPFLWYNKKMQNSFFDTLNTGAAPLAERMRAQVMNEFIGQRHVVGENSLLRRSIRADKLGSCIFWGPPGCGKTTLAHIIANATQCPFEKLNAVSSGVADAKRIIEQAEKHFALTGKSTFLLLDECHRWSKAQSDSVLSAIEKGYIRLIGSTTENPYYSMTPAIVSRCLVFEFRALSEEDIAEGLERALKSPKGLGNLNVELTEGALNQLVRLSGGDLRKAYNGLELAVLTTPRNADGKILIDEKIAAESVQKKPLSVDSKLLRHDFGVYQEYARQRLRRGVLLVQQTDRKRLRAYAACAQDCHTCFGGRWTCRPAGACSGCVGYDRVSEHRAAGGGNTLDAGDFVHLPRAQVEQRGDGVERGKERC